MRMKMYNVHMLLYSIVTPHTHSRRCCLLLLQIWNTAAAEPFVRRFLGHADHVKRCAFADTRGEAVLSCGSDGTVR